MRIGLSSGLEHKSPAEWAANLSALGCKSVVFPVDSSASNELIDAYCLAAKEFDLTIAEVGIWRNAISLDEAERQQQMDYSIKQLKLADKIGAKCCVNVSGALGSRWDGPYKENFSKEAWYRTVKMAQDIIDEVKPVNTYLTLEPMPWMYPTGPEEYAKLLEDVNRDRFAVHLDIINMINTPKRYFFPEEFLDETFDLLGSSIKSCHIKDVHLRGEFTFQLQECMVGKGEFPLKYYMQEIAELKDDVPVILEHLQTDEEYLEGLKYLQSL